MSVASDPAGGAISAAGDAIGTGAAGVAASIRCAKPGCAEAAASTSAAQAFREFGRESCGRRREGDEQGRQDED